MFDLTGKVALVTGAGQGYGAGIARAFGGQGAAVAVNDYFEDRAEKVAAEIGERGGTAIAVPFDVTDRAGIDAAVATISERLGPVDILVNNAGNGGVNGMGLVQFRDTDPADWDRIIAVNLYGVMHCTQAVIDGMCERGWGRVITISSGAGVVGLNIGVSPYAAGKGGGIGFMRHLAMEVARNGVTANTLAMGLQEMTATDATANLGRAIPVGRLGTPEDAGAAAVYLASEEASWITGQTICLDGGSVTH
jgi:NAD(P)-dependent dehydrogenase (short-subunit alcohol dehydrogenase family)